MKPFLKKLILFIIIMLLIATGMQQVLDYGLKKTAFTFDFPVWYEVTQGNINADIVIVGSSKARLQIDPKVLEHQFGLTTYNIGINNSNFLIQQYRLNKYLKQHKKPRYIILTFDHATLTDTTTCDFVQFIPYLDRELINNYSSTIKLNKKDLYLPLYKYSHQRGMVYAALTQLFAAPASYPEVYHGFQSVDGYYNIEPLIKLKKLLNGKMPFRTDHRSLTALKSLVTYCNKQHIKLILVNTPAVSDYQAVFDQQKTIPMFMSAFSDRYHLSYFNYFGDTICRDTSMFEDFPHLNKKGRVIFNKQFANDLRGIISVSK